jgi:hypothetical protein
MLTEFADAAAATMTARAGSRMHNALARQMSWQRPSRGLFSFRIDRRRGLLGDRGRSLGLRGARDEFIELQFQLIEEPRSLFR